jgi:hypothetical protein
MLVAAQVKLAYNLVVMMAGSAGLRSTQKKKVT